MLQHEALKLMTNYKRNRGLTLHDKVLMKNINRYLNKLQLLNTTPDVGDVVIDKKNIEIYRKRYTLK
jgi:hypothetical protein